MRRFLLDHPDLASFLVFVGIGLTLLGLVVAFGPVDEVPLDRVVAESLGFGCMLCGAPLGLLTRYVLVTLRENERRDQEDRARSQPPPPPPTS